MSFGSLWWAPCAGLDMSKKYKSLRHSTKNFLFLSEPTRYWGTGREEPLASVAPSGAVPTCPKCARLGDGRSGHGQQRAI